MKKLAIILFVSAMAMFIAPKSEAQTSLKSRYSVALDTVTNTGTKNMTSARVGSNWHTVTVTAVHTNLTGTMSGVARLYGSLDGVTYTRIRSQLLHNSQVDSLVIDANHTAYSWVVDNSPFQYYQVQSTGSGTVTYTVAGKYVAH